MGAEQRKHPATATGQSHISFTSSAQSATGCDQSAKTVRISFKTLNMNWIVAYFHFIAMVKLSCLFYRVFESELRMYDGDDLLDVWDR